MNAGEVTAAPPKTLPPDLPTEEKLADELAPTDIPSFLLAWLLRYPWLRFAPIVAALLLALLLLARGAAGLGSRRRRRAGGGRRMAHDPARAGARAEPGRRRVAAGLATPASVDQLEASADFRIGTPGQTPAPTAGGPDSGDAVRFKAALRNLYSVDVGERTIPPVVRRPLDMETIATTALARLDPAKTIPLRVLAGIQIPGRIRDQLVEQFGEVMVYPRIDLPMYEPLKEISSELFLPNLQLIPNEQHHAARDQPEVHRVLHGGPQPRVRPRAAVARVPDRPARAATSASSGTSAASWPIPARTPTRCASGSTTSRRFTWAVDSALGDHDNREAQGDKEEELVLVIRGELLKKYPDRGDLRAPRGLGAHRLDGAIDKTQPREARAASRRRRRRTRRATW